MDALKRILISLLFLWVWWPCGFANGPIQNDTSNIEIDEDGQVILKVFLHDVDRPGTVRAFRFALDTGSTLCALDSSVPGGFFWEDATTLNSKDVTETAMVIPVVIMKRLEVGPMVRDRIPALLTPLKNGMLGRFEDEPVDGILGLGFLEGTRFLLDVERKRLEWGGKGSPAAAVLPMVCGRDKSRLLNVKVGGKEGLCRVDTGMLAGLVLPGSLRPAGTGSPSMTLGFAEAPKAGEMLEVAEVEAEGRAWKKVPVVFQNGKEIGVIGMEVWAAGPVCFDFIREQLTLTLDPKMGLPWQRNRSPALPIAWDRTDHDPKLIMWWVKPGSPMEAAGLQSGDEIIRVGSLTAKNLSRRALKKIINEGKPQPWLVKRKTATFRLIFPPPVRGGAAGS